MTSKQAMPSLTGGVLYVTIMQTDNVYDVTFLMILLNGR